MPGSKLHLGSAIALGAFLALPALRSRNRPPRKQVTFSKDVAPDFAVQVPVVP